MSGKTRAGWLCISVLVSETALAQRSPRPDVPASNQQAVPDSPKPVRDSTRQGSRASAADVDALKQTADNYAKSADLPSDLNEKLSGAVLGGNVPTDLWVKLMDRYDDTLGSAKVLPDGSFTFRKEKIDSSSKPVLTAGGGSKGLKVLFIRKNGDTFAEVKIGDWSGGPLVVSLPPNAYFKVRLAGANAEQVDGEIRIDGEATGRTNKVISTPRGAHHLDAVVERCLASLKKHHFFNLEPTKPEEIELRCGHQN